MASGAFLELHFEKISPRGAPRGVSLNVPGKFLEKKRRGSYRCRAGKPTHC